MFVVTEELSSFPPHSLSRGASTTVKIVLDKPYTAPLTISSFGFPFSKRKVSEFGAQMSSSTGLSTSAGYPPRSPENGPLLPCRGLHLSRPASTFTTLTSGCSLCHCNLPTCCEDIALKKLQVNATWKHTDWGTDCKQQPAVMLHFY